MEKLQKKIFQQNNEYAAYSCVHILNTCFFCATVLYIEQKEWYLAYNKKSFFWSILAGVLLGI